MEPIAIQLWDAATIEARVAVRVAADGRRVRRMGRPLRSMRPTVTPFREDHPLLFPPSAAAAAGFNGRVEAIPGSPGITICSFLGGARFAFFVTVTFAPG